MRFCVKCGTDVEQPVDGLCIECYLDGREFTSLPQYMDLDVCAVCHEFYMKNRWIDRETRKAVEDAAVNELRVIEGSRVISISTYSKVLDPKTYEVHVIAELSVRDVTIESEAVTTVRIKNTVCKRCSRVQGSYYESILQVRSEERALDGDTVDEAVRTVMKYVDREAETNRQYFISKVVKIHGGVDFYISSIALGRILSKKISDKYCGETKESFKLVGRKPDGQDMYRITYLVRLPKFKVGDVVIWKDRYFRLSSISATGGRLISLKEFKPKSIPRADMSNMKVYRTEDELIDATVVSGNPPEIQVLNPTTLETVDMKVPKDADLGETVKVIDIEGTMYYVP